jgi:lipid-A-disaccharide synthase
VRDRAHEVLIASDLALAKPGTVTVEAMLLDRPMVVFGRAHPITAALVRRMVSVPWLAMPNLIAGAAIVPELLQEQATPARLADAVVSLLDRDAAAAQRRALADAARRLGGGGASARVADIVERMLDGPPA